MSKTEATGFVATGSLLTGFANCMGLGCHESPSNRIGGYFLIRTVFVLLYALAYSFPFLLT